MKSAGDTPRPPPHGRASPFAGWVGGLMLVVLCAAAYLPGLRALPPVDRDESRFAQASKQMLDSGTLRGWVVPMVGDKPRLNKPPIIYWLQSASAAAFDLPSAARLDAPRARRDALQTGGVWVFRVPSVLAALAATLITWRLGLSMFGAGHARTAWIAAAILASSFIVVWDARQARADQLLLAVTTAALAALWSCWKQACATDERARRPAIAMRSVLLFWLLVGVGIMSKGPVTPMVAALTAVALSAATGRWRWMRSMRPVAGVAIVLACGLPWVLLVGSEVGWSAYLAIIKEEVLGRSVAPSEGHWGPPGYHAVLLPLMFFPGSMLTAAGLALAWKRSREIPAGATVAAAGPGKIAAWLERFRTEKPARPELFLLCWLGPAWLVFELISTKLPHYTMPLYPALALLSARAVTLAASSSDAARALGLGAFSARLGLALWLVIGAGLGIALPITLAALGGFAAAPGVMLALGGLIGCAGGLVFAGGRALWRGHYVLAQGLGVALVLLTASVVFHIVLPRLRAPWVSSRLWTIIEREDPKGVARIGAVGFHEDSLKFLTSGRLVRLGPKRAVEWAREHPGAILVLPVEISGSSFPEAEKLGSVLGLNYSKGEWVDLVVVRAP